MDKYLKNDQFLDFENNSIQSICAKISELKKEAKSDDDGKFYLESLHTLNARHG